MDSETYLKSIDRTLKLILAEMQKPQQPKKKTAQPVTTKDDIQKKAVQGKPPDKKHKAFK